MAIYTATQIVDLVNSAQMAIGYDQWTVDRAADPHRAIQTLNQLIATGTYTGSKGQIAASSLARIVDAAWKAGDINHHSGYAQRTHQIVQDHFASALAENDNSWIPMAA